MDPTSVTELAAHHGLFVTPIGADNTGWDFEVVHAVDDAGVRWVLRVPRRPEVVERLPTEHRLLELVRPRLPIEVPRWEVCGHELIAYRRLAGEPLVDEDPVVLTSPPRLDAVPEYFDTLGAVLAELHSIPLDEVVALDIPNREADRLRAELLAELEEAESRLTVPRETSRSWRDWLGRTSNWRRASRLTHGDPHPAHTLVDGTGRLRGLLDWADAAIADPAVDFMHCRFAFGREGLRRLLDGYARSGGRPSPAGPAAIGRDAPGCGAADWDAFHRHVELLSEFCFSVSLALHGLRSGRADYLAIGQHRLTA